MAADAARILPHSDTLATVTRLFDAVHAADLRYCHWKSNQHLHASMVGATDFDLLVDRPAVPLLARILSESGFKRFATPGWRAYPGIESYVGLDAETGVLLHLHVHYRLTVGEKYLKGYRLPWEEQVLSTRVFDQRAGIYVVDPNLEYLLLMVRATLKVRLRDAVLARCGRSYISGSVAREFRWLVERVQPDCLARLGRELLGARAAARLTQLLTDTPPSLTQLLDFGRLAEPPLRDYRTYGPVGARWRRLLREGRSAVARRVVRFGALTPTGLVLPQGGVVVAFVGADGAGKSTIVREISAWLGSLVHTVPVYFGTGQGPASWPRRLLERVAAAARRGGSAATVPRDAAGRGTGSSPVRTAGEMLWVLSLARERRQRVAKARRARNLGLIVACDRYPQSRWIGNDGPCLAHWSDSSSRLKRWVARRELAALRGADELRPDLIVKLAISPELALRRKPDTPPRQLQAKFHAITNLCTASETRVVEIDAARPLDQVLLEAKRAIWSSL